MPGTEAVEDSRFSATRVDASSSDVIAGLVRERGITHVVNAVDPRGYEFAPVVLHLDHHRGVSQPARHLGERPGLVQG